MSTDRKHISIYSYDRQTEIKLPDGYRYTLGEEETGQRITMADGSQVYEQTGLRRTLSIECGYLPDATYKSLLALRRTNPWVYAIYVDVDCSEVSGIYSITIGKRELFNFRVDGSPLFKGVTIELVEREVH